MIPPLTLYTNPLSRGRIAVWMMEEVGAPYDLQNLDYESGMKSPEYLAINPMGKVPALVHGDNVVTEAAAICAYMADTFPDAGLLPAATERGAYYRWLFYAAGPVEQAVTNRMLGMEIPDERRATVGYGNYALVMDTLEYAVSQHDYIAGNRFTAADVYMGSAIGWGLQFGTIEKRTAFVEYWERVSDRDTRRRAEEKALAGIDAG